MQIYDIDQFRLVYVSDPPPAVDPFDEALHPNLYPIPDEYLFAMPEQVPGVVSGGPDLEGVGGFW